MDPMLCWFLMQKICASVLSRLHGDFLCSGVHFNYSCRKVSPNCLKHLTSSAEVTQAQIVKAVFP